jgi:hypothetical protein
MLTHGSVTSSPAHVFLLLCLTQVARVLIAIMVPETLRKGKA